MAFVSRFEYVTYNGRRVSIADAEEEVRLMRWCSCVDLMSLCRLTSAAKLIC